jgi:hypothetical protein
LLCGPALGLHHAPLRSIGVSATKRRWAQNSDNLKAAVVRACFFDPDSHDVYLAFATHWGFTPLPTQPRRPEENGKQERSGGYVKDNALKGRRFDSLDAQNAFLRHWNRTIARLRIHGTTRRQVWTHFVEVEQRALHPLAREAFPLFASGERTVHTDGHVEVGGAFYPVHSRCSVSGSACDGTLISYASSTATPWSWSMPGLRPACLRRAPARPKPRAVSKPLPIGWSGNASGSARRSSSGPTRRSRLGGLLRFYYREAGRPIGGVFAYDAVTLGITIRKPTQPNLKTPLVAQSWFLHASVVALIKPAAL